MWRLHFEHHDRNDDGNHTVTEGFEAALIHSGPDATCLAPEKDGGDAVALFSLILPSKP